jgi:hypothetical protein
VSVLVMPFTPTVLTNATAAFASFLLFLLPFLLLLVLLLLLVGLDVRAFGGVAAGAFVLDLGVLLLILLEGGEVMSALVAVATLQNANLEVLAVVGEVFGTVASITVLGALGALIVVHLYLVG